MLVPVFSNTAELGESCFLLTFQQTWNRQPRVLISILPLAIYQREAGSIPFPFSLPFFLLQGHLNLVCSALQMWKTVLDPVSPVISMSRWPAPGLSLNLSLVSRLRNYSPETRALGRLKAHLSWLRLSHVSSYPGWEKWGLLFFLS